MINFNVGGVTELESGETTANHVNVNLRHTKSDAARDGQYDVMVRTDKARWSEAVAPQESGKFMVLEAMDFWNTCVSCGLKRLGLIRDLPST